MAEELRSIEEILNELFKGRDAALEKYSRVRHTQYEMLLWRDYGLPLYDVDKSAKAYFSKKFLSGVKIDKADGASIQKAFERLNHAVKDGCHGRCLRLVEELNQALAELGLKTVDPEPFLDWLTYDYVAKRGTDGELVEDKPYGFPILVFSDGQNRKELWAELSLMLKSGRISSMQYATSILKSKRLHTVTISKKG